MLIGSNVRLPNLFSNDSANEDGIMPPDDAVLLLRSCKYPNLELFYDPTRSCRRTKRPGTVGIVETYFSILCYQIEGVVAQDDIR